jgi:hypothetical protein
MVLGASGEVGVVLELRDHAAKMGGGRLTRSILICNKPFQLCGNRLLARDLSYALNAADQ